MNEWIWKDEEKEIGGLKAGAKGEKSFKKCTKIEKKKKLKGELKESPQPAVASYYVN